MLTVSCFLWTDPRAKNRDIYTYGPEHVYTLKRMVDRHLTLPHRFVCVTDAPASALPGIETAPIDWTHHLPGTRFVKLMMYGPDAAKTIGKRVLMLDLDTAIVSNIDTLVDRDEDLVVWRNPNYGGPKRARYNTSIVLHSPGTRTEFYDRFDKTKHPDRLRQYVGGTDQAWVSHLASPDEAHWTDKDGVYGAGRLLDIVPGVKTTLPDNARVVFFPGRREPSMPEIKHQHPWLAEHYR